MTIEYFRGDNRPNRVSPLEAKLNEIIDAINSGDIGSGSGSSAANAMTLVDLGTVNVVDLIDGPQTLYTPAAGTYFQLLFSPEDFVAPNYYTVCGNDGDDGLAFGPVVNYAYMFIAADGNNSVETFAAKGVFDQVSQVPAEHNLRAMIGPDFGNVVAALHLFWDDVSLLEPAGSWQANHLFPAASVIIAGGKFFTSSGGTSDVSEPDWASASPAGDTVTDGTVTWTFQGGASGNANVPTQGTLHFYALVASPGSGGSGYVPGTDRMCVTITNMTVGLGNQQIDWSTGTPTVYSQGTAIVTSGTDIAIAEDGVYNVHVHLPDGVDDGGGDPVSIGARLIVGGLGTQADGDIDAHHAGLSQDDACLSAGYTWIATAGDTVNCNLVCSGAGHVGSAIAQIVRLSDLAGGDP